MMQFWRNLTVGLACGAFLLLPGQEGLSVAPHTSASDYAGQAQTDRVTFGAELLPRHQVSRLFTPLADQYYVVEVAAYPLDDHTLNLERGQFRLRVDGKTLKAQNPQAIATFLVQTAPPAPGMHTTAHRSESVGVRMETGRPTEVFREERAGVGISNGRYWNSEDRETMYRELSSLELPEGPTSSAIAGYLYFAIKSKQKPESIEWIYRSDSENMILRLP